MRSIFETAANISTPLMLAGFISAAFFFVARQALHRNAHHATAAHLSDRMFVLSIVAMILGCASFIVEKVYQPTPNPAPPAPVPFPDIPGGTGWIFAGYVDRNSRHFTEGPYVEDLYGGAPRTDEDLHLGDKVRMKVSHQVIILNFKNNGIKQQFIPPTEVNLEAKAIQDKDLTDVVLPNGSEALIRDKQTGFEPGRPQEAVWLRIVKIPE